MHWVQQKGQIMLEGLGDARTPNSALDQRKAATETGRQLSSGTKKSTGNADIKIEPTKSVAFEPENRCGVYMQFRNYQI